MGGLVSRRGFLAALAVLPGIGLFRKPPTRKTWRPDPDTTYVPGKTYYIRTRSAILEPIDGGDIEGICAALADAEVRKSIDKEFLEALQNGKM